MGQYREKIRNITKAGLDPLLRVSTVLKEERRVAHHHEPTRCIEEGIRHKVQLLHSPLVLQGIVLEVWLGSSPQSCVLQHC